ncbi:MAG: dnaE [Bacillales bacterium]|nr:dnaE [Bacillales bacterium]
MSFVHLQVRSAYSLLESTISIEELVSSAAKKGYKAIAITDHNVLYGAVQFYQECKKQKIKPIIGLTADILSEDEQSSFPMVLLAMNNQGYQNLVKISSALQTKSKKGLPFRWLNGYSGGLIAITPGPDGEIEAALRENRFTDAIALVRKYQSVFTENRFFLSLHKSQATTAFDVQLKQLGAPLVAGQRVQYLEQQDKSYLEAIICLGNNLTIDEAEFTEFEDNHLSSIEELRIHFSNEAECVRNSGIIADRCEVELEFGQTLLPEFPVPDGKTAAQFLRENCKKGFQFRYSNPTPIHFERLEYELSVISKMNFDDYFLIVWDFMTFARKQGILTGPGRGSAAGSIVSYVLGITNIDPIEYELLFERFLNPERISMPDIDIDFPDNRREEMIQYVAKKYGQIHVAQIITFGTFGPKAAIRDAGRVFGLVPADLDQLSKMIPSTLGTTLKSAFTGSNKLQELYKNNPLYNKIIKTAFKWEGLPRHTSVHAAGIVISRIPITELVPIQEGHDNVLLTQFPMDQLEKIGLLKMDFLGLRNLTILNNVLTEINKVSKQKIALNRIPLDDAKTYDLICRGDTIGVFQLESDGMRNVIRKLKPSCMEDIIAVNALFRPGPMDNISLFIKRKHGEESIDYPHPDLKPILQNTYGIIVYQEQILRIASLMAGFSLGEADLLRKAVSKKNKDVLDQERAHFVKGSLNKGYSEQVATNVYDLIVKFANYGFNRSHSVAYATIAYQMAFLKANYPRFFMAELMTSLAGNEDKIAHFIQELRTQDVEILGPSINQSGYGFQVEKENSLRFGLSAIKFVSGAAIKEIFSERRNGLFKGFFDFVSRLPQKVINQKTLEALIFSGTFDEFGKDRSVLFASIEVAFETANLNELGGMIQVEATYVEMDPINTEELLQKEKQYLGIYLSAHPVSTYKKAWKKLCVVPISEMKEGSKVLCGAYIHRIKTTRTKNGEMMAFLSIGDETGEIETVVFPRTFQPVADKIEKGNVLVFEGKIEEKNSRKQLIANRIFTVEDALEFVKTTC